VTATGAGAENGLLPARPLDPAGPAAAEALSEGEAGAAGSLLRAGVCVVACVLAAVVSVLLVRHGIRTDEFPPFLPGTSGTPITRYSGPWITAGAGAALLAVLFLLFAVVNVVRWSRSRSGGSRSAGSAT
jgi:hypothetical protein